MSDIIEHVSVYRLECLPDADAALLEVDVTGYSMLPLLGRGHDRVVVRPCRTSELTVGRIVLFHLGNRWIVHRIRHRDGERFIMAGDGNYRKTERCSAQEIIGIVDSVIRSDAQLAYGREIMARTASTVPTLHYGRHAPHTRQKTTKQRMIWI